MRHARLAAIVWIQQLNDQSRHDFKNFGGNDTWVWIGMPKVRLSPSHFSTHSCRDQCFHRVTCHHHLYPKSPLPLRRQQDHPLLLCHILSGTRADEEFVPALCSRMGGTPSPNLLFLFHFSSPCSLIHRRII